MGLQFGQGLSVAWKSLKHTQRNWPKAYHKVGKYKHENGFLLFFLTLTYVFNYLPYSHRVCGPSPHFVVVSDEGDTQTENSVVSFPVGAFVSTK